METIDSQIRVEMPMPEPPRPQKSILWEILALCLLLCVSIPILYTPKETVRLKFDCAAYAAQSINLYEGEGNTMDMGGVRLPGFYPMGYPLLTVPIHWILGPDLQNGVVANLVMSLITLLLVYLLGRSLAGPWAGALSWLLLLGSETFRHVAHMIYSQTSSLMFVALICLLFHWGWKPGAWGWILRFLGGLLAGLLIFIRSSNVVMAPAAALFSILVRPVENQSRIRTALPVCLGAGLSAALLLIHNTISYGGPLNTAYMAWGFDLKDTFSLSYIFEPVRKQLDLSAWPLLGSAFGFGMLYTWPVALLGLAGSAFILLRRKTQSTLWRQFVFMMTSTLFLYAFLAIYFFRSPVYTMLTTPMIFCFAACAGVLMAGKRWTPILLLGGVIQLYPVLHEAPNEPPKDVIALKAAHELLEDNAVVLSGVNPVQVEYLLARHTQRRCLFLTKRQEAQFQAMFRKELGADALSLKRVEEYVRRHLLAKVPVYFLLIIPDPVDQQCLAEVYQHLNKRFKMNPTPRKEILRIELKPKSPAPKK